MQETAAGARQDTQHRRAATATPSALPSSSLLARVMALHEGDRTSAEAVGTAPSPTASQASQAAAIEELIALLRAQMTVAAAPPMAAGADDDNGRVGAVSGAEREGDEPPAHAPTREGPQPRASSSSSSTSSSSTAVCCSTTTSTDTAIEVGPSTSAQGAASSCGLTSPHCAPAPSAAPSPAPGIGGNHPSKSAGIGQPQHPKKAVVQAESSTQAKQVKKSKARKRSSRATRSRSRLAIAGEVPGGHQGDYSDRSSQTPDGGFVEEDDGEEEGDEDEDEAVEAAVEERDATASIVTSQPLIENCFGERRERAAMEHAATPQKQIASRRRHEKTEELIPIAFLNNALFLPPPTPGMTTKGSESNAPLTKRVRGKGTGDPKYTITLVRPLP